MRSIRNLFVYFLNNALSCFQIAVSLSVLRSRVNAIFLLQMRLFIRKHNFLIKIAGDIKKVRNKRMKISD